MIMENPRGRILIAWTLCVVASIVSLIGLGSDLVVGRVAGQSSGITDKILFDLLPVVFTIPAVLIISRQPRNTIGWLLMTPGLTMAITGGMDSYLSTFKTAPPVTLPIMMMMLFSSGSWVGLIFPLLLIPLLFPTGRPLTARWQWVIYLAVGLILFFFIWAAGSRIFQLDFASWSVTNPYAFLPEGAEQYIMPPWVVMLAVLAASSLASFVVRFRRAEVVERQQMKWLLYACVLFVLIFVPSLFSVPDNSSQTSNNLFNLLFPVAIITMPVAITIAILRYHLFDIDVIIRLTLVYAIVTTLLGLVYVSGVALLQAAFRRLTGQTSDLAVLITTLVIATLFTPLRAGIQALINRRFYRQKYNAEQALAQFANAARGSSDLDALTGMLAGLVMKTLQPTEVAVLMKTNDSRRLVGLQADSSQGHLGTNLQTSLPSFQED
jgi:hypothetical protein